MLLGPEPNLKIDNRADHIASEREIKHCMDAAGNHIIEVSAISITFVISYPMKTLLRTSVMGGDQFEIEGGWVYSNPFSLALDVKEIMTLPTARQIQ